MASHGRTHPFLDLWAYMVARTLDLLGLKYAAKRTISLQSIFWSVCMYAWPMPIMCTHVQCSAVKRRTCVYVLTYTKNAVHLWVTCTALTWVLSLAYELKAGARLNQEKHAAARACGRILLRPECECVMFHSYRMCFVSARVSPLASRTRC